MHWMEIEERQQLAEELAADMANHATTQSLMRCPYKNRFNECTAQFGCRNQNRDVPAGQLYICTSSDNLDYRSAWDT